MKLKNLLRLYQMSKTWDIVNDKLSIPESDLPKLDIRDGRYELKEEYNLKSNNPRGVFMPDMTDEDYAHYLQQQTGWKKFYDKVKGLK